MHFIKPLIRPLQTGLKRFVPFIFLIALTGCIDNLPIGGDSGPAVNLSEPIKVALLVPSGAGDPVMNAIGVSLSNAGKMAQSANNNNDIDLKIYSTGGSPALALQKAQEAVNDGAKIIIGPLKSEEAAVVASAVNVPVMTFSNNSAIAASNTYVLGTTFDVIADRVIKYGKSQGDSRLGVVYTNDLAGQQGLEASDRAASKNRVDVVTRAGYDLNLNAIQTTAPQIAQSLRGSGADMVMFTDNPAGGLGHMSVQLLEQGYSNQTAQYLGMSRWDANSTALAQSGLEGGIFAQPDPNKNASFENNYVAQYGIQPHALAGLAYDGVLASIQLVQNAKNRGDITPFGADNISRSSFNGALGAFRFKDNMADRALAVMQIRNGQAVVISLAPNTK